LGFNLSLQHFYLWNRATGLLLC